MEETCGACKHFRRHYIKLGWRYEPIDDGHCVKPRCKMRKAKTPACGYFQKKEETSSRDGGQP